ncbi:MAG: hypothetical protein JJT88_10320 [Gammaproteobacteria bacterium]|nr:hypothetical protein [Gammaproteobacteria bacterium]
MNESTTVAERLQPALAARGLKTLDDFLAYSDATPVSRRGKRPVRPLRLSVNGSDEGFYLKQFRLTPRHLITEIIKRRLPVLASTGRELAIIRLLEQHDVPVMTPVAWGERRRFGLPVAGFLLVSEVVGEPLVDRYLRAALPLQKRLRYLHGCLIGTLHRQGIFTKVRPRDVIVVRESWDDFRNSLVVIDRERGKTAPVELTTKQRAKQLADVWCKSGTELGLGTWGELSAFMTGYFRATGTPPSERSEMERAMLAAGLRFLGLKIGAASEFRKLWRSRLPQPRPVRPSL